MSTAGDFPRSKGAAAIGARLRRLSERIDREAGQVYADLEIEFEQRWFGVINQLVLREACSVGDLAALLGVTHAAVSQVRSALEARGFVAPRSDPSDARRTVLTLTPAGKRLAKRLGDIWSAMDQVARDLDREADGVVAALDRLEQALDRQSISARVKQKRG